MATINGIVTTVGLAHYPSPSPGSPTLLSFAVGRGGWINPGGGVIPRIPDPSLQDLDIIQNPGRYPNTPGNIYFVQKSFIADDFSLISPSVQQVRCRLDFIDFNDIQGVPSTPPYPTGPVLPLSGTSPDIWEIGIFIAAPGGYTNPTADPTSPLYQGRPNQMMVIYGTFSAERKSNSLQIENDVIITFP